mmetsp:Transcript_120547/g.335684  ORF Transcript_120547/g.335684 Transcript_120547/m.335684 type:complete len:209 (-) Transcript_120547:671-1297(-)
MQFGVVEHPHDTGRHRPQQRALPGAPGQGLCAAILGQRLAEHVQPVQDAAELAQGLALQVTEALGLRAAEQALRPGQVLGPGGLQAVGLQPQQIALQQQPRIGRRGVARWVRQQRQRLGRAGLGQQLRRAGQALGQRTRGALGLGGSHRRSRAERGVRHHGSSPRRRHLGRPGCSPWRATCLPLGAESSQAPAARLELHRAARLLNDC